MHRHFGFPKQHQWNRPLAVRHLPIDIGRYGFRAVRVVLTALAFALVGLALALIYFVAPIFTPHDPMMF
jgi:hypothetical protein